MPLGEGGSWQLGGFCTMTGSQGGPSVTEHGWALTSSSSLCLLRCAVVLSSQGGAMADSGSPPPARTSSALRAAAGCCNPLCCVSESLFQTHGCTVWLSTGCDNGNGLMSLNHPLSEQFMGHHVASQHQGCSAASTITSLLELDHGSLETIL